VGFGQSITEIQQSVGDYFAPAQGGRFMSRVVEDAITWLGAHGAVAMGQSSWGPTGFGLVESEAKAAALLQEMQQKWPSGAGLKFVIARGRNRGGDIEVIHNAA
ncbi:MAG TPA: GHMP kinase, partial [Dongiaceae bacterium]